MPVLLRKPLHLGPVTLHFTQDGYKSWSFKVGKLSWNSRARRLRFDLPGPFSWVQRKSRR